MTAAPRLVRRLRAEGYTVAHTGGGHLKITRPDMAKPVYTGASPSDRRTERNLRAILRRARKKD